MPLRRRRGQQQKMRQTLRWARPMICQRCSTSSGRGSKQQQATRKPAPSVRKALAGQPRQRKLQTGSGGACVNMVAAEAAGTARTGTRAAPRNRRCHPRRRHPPPSRQGDCRARVQSPRVVAAAHPGPAGSLVLEKAQRRAFRLNGAQFLPMQPVAATTGTAAAAAAPAAPTAARVQLPADCGPGFRHFQSE